MQPIIDLSTFVAVVFTINFLAQWANNSWTLDGWGARIRSWVMGILVGLIGMELKIGIFATPIFDPTIVPLWAVDSILGFLAALVANFGYDKLPFVKLMLEWLKIRVDLGDTPLPPSGSLK